MTSLKLRLSALVLLGLALCPIFGHRILDEVPLIDGHNDLPYNLYTLLRNNLSAFDFNKNLTSDPVWGKCKSCYTDLPRLRAGKVGAQFWVAYVACDTQYKDSLALTLEQIDVIKRLVQKYPNDLEFVTTADGISSAYARGKIASLIGIEGGHSMDSRLGVLRMLYDLGARYMTLTHACNTPWADNSYVDDSKPVHNLTDFGKLVVREMNRLGMLVDLSHVSHQVMNQAINISVAPVIFSHSSSFHVYNHNRNVHNDTLKLVKSNGGIVMVNFYTEFVGAKNVSIIDVANHINAIVDVTGVDHVGIGGDYDGVPSQPIGLEDVSKYPNLFTLLQNSNPGRWTDASLKKLASGNFLRVFKQVEIVRDILKNDVPQETWISVLDLNKVDKSEKVWQCRTLLNAEKMRSGSNSAPSMSNSITTIGLLSIVYYFITNQL